MAAPEASVTARPVTTARWVLSIAAGIVLVFLVFAIMLPPSATMGAHVTFLDRLSMFGLGVAVAAVVACPAWPRMRADAAGVRMRGFVGGYREVPWSLVHAVEFPPTARWARLVLADDEALTLYAVQRADGAASVEVMDRLRALHRAARR
ncbi:MAG: putative rane protein [Jatrophihabitantaceae bacterium]|nr:putative rane protein [Jatrophihabitantaceae bacterium]